MKMFKQEPTLSYMAFLQVDLTLLAISHYKVI